MSVIIIDYYYSNYCFLHIGQAELFDRFNAIKSCHCRRIATHDESTCCPRMWRPHTAASRHIDLLCCHTVSEGTEGSGMAIASYPWVRLLCRHSIDPTAVTELPVEYSYRAMMAAMVEVSHSWWITSSGVFAHGRGALLSLCCSIDSLVWPDY